MQPEFCVRSVWVSARWGFLQIISSAYLIQKTSFTISYLREFLHLHLLVVGVSKGIYLGKGPKIKKRESMVFDHTPLTPQTLS